MNFETVLLYNFDEGEKARKIKMVLLKMKVKIKKVSKEQYLEPIGFLAGNKEIPSSGDIYEGGRISRGNACDERIYKQQDRLAIKGVSKSGNRES